MSVARVFVAAGKATGAAVHGVGTRLAVTCSQEPVGRSERAGAGPADDCAEIIFAKRVSGQDHRYGNFHGQSYGVVARQRVRGDLCAVHRDRAAESESVVVGRQAVFSGSRVWVTTLRCLPQLHFRAWR